MIQVIMLVFLDEFNARCKIEDNLKERVKENKHNQGNVDGVNECH